MALSLETELENYRKMKPGDPASEAVVPAYRNDSTCSLLKTQNRYIQNLKKHMYHVHEILGKTSDRNARRFFDASTSIYDRKILPALEDVFINFEKASEIHSYLVSGDYMMNRFYLESAKTAMKNADDGTQDELVAELTSVIEEYRCGFGELPVIKEDPGTGASCFLQISRHVHAMDDEAFLLSSVAANFYREAKRIFKNRKYTPASAPSPFP